MKKKTVAMKGAVKRRDRAIFSIGEQARGHAAWLVGRYRKIDGRYAASQTDVVRDLIERAYRSVRNKC
ncbi:MAG: hypothetical protein ACYC8W_07830 [Candidatus Tyrphobacter sp.]